MTANGKFMVGLLAGLVAAVSVSLIIVLTWEHETGNFPEPGIKVISKAYAQKRSGVIAEVEGRVTRILMDANEGPQQQQFVINLQDGRALLVKHSAGKSSRIPLAVDDRVTVKGTYYWSEPGGVLRWTSSETGSGYESGWVEHKGKRYE